MTREEYQNAGYEVSLQINQAIIDRAEADVCLAYIAPIAPNYSVCDTTTKQAIMNLAYLCMLQRSLKLTRSGAKEKTAAESVNASESSKVAEQARICHLYLEALRHAEGSNTNAAIVDICGIYYITNLFYL